MSEEHAIVVDLYSSTLTLVMASTSGSGCRGGRGRSSRSNMQGQRSSSVPPGNTQGQRTPFFATNAALTDDITGLVPLGGRAGRAGARNPLLTTREALRAERMLASNNSRRPQPSSSTEEERRTETAARRNANRRVRRKNIRYKSLLLLFLIALNVSYNNAVKMRG